MKINDCTNCPFRVDEWDPDSSGFDMLCYCNLSRFKNLKYDIITVYDTWKEEEQKIITPEWCPLKEDSITIELE